MSTAPRVRRPRQTVYGAVQVLYIEGAGAPYKVVPADRAVRDTYGPRATLHACRLWRDAVAYATSGQADQALAALLNDEVAA